MFDKQGMIRIYIFYGKRLQFKQFVEQIFEVTKEYQNIPFTRDVVRLYSHQTYLQSLVFMILFISTGVISIVYCFPFIIFNGELMLPFGFVLPGLDYTAHPYYELNYLYQFIQVLFTTPGLLGAHLANMFFTLNLCLQLEIIMLKLKMVGQELYNKERTNEKVQDTDLTPIVQMHQNSLEYKNSIYLVALKV